MQMTTLMQAPLTLASVQYQYAQEDLQPTKCVIKITTTSAHGIKGDVKIQLANVVVANVNGIANYFNTTIFVFRRSGANTLETTFDFNAETFSNAKNILQYQNTTGFQTLPNNGSAITANVNNAKFILTPNGQRSIHFDDTSNYVGTAGESSNLANFVLTQYFELDNANESVVTNETLASELQNNSVINLRGTTIECEVKDFTTNTRLILTIK